MYYGDIRLGDSIDIKFTTRSFSTGAPTQLAGSPAVSAYVGNGTTEITAGITLTVDFDARTGLNNVRVVATSGNGYATATNVQLVITAGTVGGVSVVGEMIGSFSIEARSAVMPTTAGRTLDVTATGAAGIDWGNVENPTTAVNLSGTNIDTDQVVASVTGAVGSVTGAVGSVTGLTNATIADAVWDEDATAHQTQGTFGQAIGDPGADTDTIWALVNTNLNATVSSRASQTSVDTIDDFLDTEIAAILADTNELQTDWVNGGRLDLLIDAIKAKTDNLPAAPAATGDIPTAAAIADAVWDEAQADHVAAGSFGITASEIADILVDTAEIGAAGAGLTAINLPDQTMNITGNITGNLSGSVGSVTGAVGSVTAGVTVTTNNDKTGYALSAAGVDAVWDEATSGHVTAGTYGVAVTDILADTAVIGAAGAGLTAIPWNAAWDAEVQSEVNDGLVAYDAATGTDVTTAAANVSVDEIQATALADLFNTDSGTTYASAVAGSVVKEIADNAGGSALTEAGIADAVWDELLSGHVVSGSAGEALAAAGTAGDPWTTALPGAYGAGTAGKIIGDNLNATVSSRASQTSVDTIDDFLDTEIAAILADTNELQTDWANGGRLDLILDARASQTSVDTIDGNVDTILADTNDIQTRLPAALVGGRIDASVGAMAANTLTASALATDAVTEIQSGLSTLDAAGVRTAVGLASANLDTQLGDLPTAVENADALLGRNVSGGSSAGRTVKQALHVLRNKTEIAGGTLTVYDTDDTTSSFTAAVTTTAGDPVSAIDPA